VSKVGFKSIFKINLNLNFQYSFVTKPR